jgi:flagellar hook-basal body complex protein FliE
MRTSEFATDNIQRVLEQIRAASSLAGPSEAASAASSTGDAGAVDFGNVLRAAVQQVSDVQQTATSKQQEFQLGESNVSLEEVMVSLQKANLAFQGMIQVRNRLVEAYREVANLQL